MPYLVMQGTHGYLIHDAPLHEDRPRFTLLSPYTSPLLSTVGSLKPLTTSVTSCHGRRRSMCFDGAFFYNALGRTPAIVHQYNRFPEVARRVQQLWTTSSHDFQELPKVPTSKKL